MQVAAQGLGTENVHLQQLQSPPDVLALRSMFCKMGSATRSLVARGSPTRGPTLLCTVLCLASQTLLLCPSAAAQAFTVGETLVEEPDSSLGDSAVPLSAAALAPEGAEDLDPGMDLGQCGEVIWFQTFESPTIEEQIGSQDGVAFPEVPTLTTCAPMSPTYSCLLHLALMHCVSIYRLIWCIVAIRTHVWFPDLLPWPILLPCLLDVIRIRVAFHNASLHHLGGVFGNGPAIPRCTFRTEILLRVDTWSSAEVPFAVLLCACSLYNERV